MSAVRFTRAATRTTAQLRAPVQRRFASTQNEFIKERQHIKEHATGTTGKSTADDAELCQLEAWAWLLTVDRAVEEDLPLVRPKLIL